MALADPYATADEYKLQKGKTSDTDDASLERELVAVSRYIDSKVGRPLGFQKDAAAVQRVYVCRWGSDVLDIDDHVSISAIALDSGNTGAYDEALTPTDYELLPRNATTMPLPEPYRQIRLTSWGSRGAWVPGGRVRVTGIGGWPAVPAAIVAACIELTAILRVESPRATSTVNEVGTVIGMSGAAQNIVTELRRTYLNPAVLV